MAMTDVRIELTSYSGAYIENYSKHYKEKEEEATITSMGGAAIESDESNADEPPLPVFTEEEVHVGEKYIYHDTLSDLIGLGSYGVVFKGIDLAMNKPIAVKKLARVNIKENELSVIKSLKSNYLVGVLDMCDIDPLTSCVIMELCDGDLENHLRSKAMHGCLTPNNLRLIIDNLARGYKALYELKIVHRDIKPQNILVTYAGRSKEFTSAKITDFGIARTLEEGSLCNVAGTLYYMAPEVGANLLKTCQYDARVDMWSIGCLLYQCLTGEVPFDEPSLCRLFLYTACANYDAYDYPDLPEDTHDAVKELIQELLEIDPGKRAMPLDFYESAVAYSELTPIML